MGKEYFYRSINDAAPDALKEFKAEFDQDAEIQQLGLDLYQDLLVKLATAFLPNHLPASTPDRRSGCLEQDQASASEHCVCP